MKKITLITSSELLSHCKHEHVGILIESASDSHFSTMFTRATPIMDLIGHPDERRQFAGQWQTPWSGAWGPDNGNPLRSRHRLSLPAPAGRKNASTLSRGVPL